MTWQPIGTARRDGSFVVLRAFNVILDGGIRYTSDPYCSWWVIGEYKWARWPHRFPPTHWMPLPAPPEPGARPREKNTQLAHFPLASCARGAYTPFIKTRGETEMKLHTATNKATGFKWFYTKRVMFGRIEYSGDCSAAFVGAGALKQTWHKTLAEARREAEKRGSLCAA